MSMSGRLDNRYVNLDGERRGSLFHHKEIVNRWSSFEEQFQVVSNSISNIEIRIAEIRQQQKLSDQRLEYIEDSE